MSIERAATACWGDIITCACIRSRCVKCFAGSRRLPRLTCCLRYLAVPFKSAGRAKDYLPLLLRFGPFPEPLLAGTDRTLNLWRRNRVERIIREDLRDLSRLPELSQVEMLATLLPERAAKPAKHHVVE